VFPLQPAMIGIYDAISGEVLACSNRILQQGNRCQTSSSQVSPTTAVGRLHHRVTRLVGGRCFAFRIPSSCLSPLKHISSASPNQAFTPDLRRAGMVYLLNSRRLQPYTTGGTYAAALVSRGHRAGTR
jgi:hypothetical protein